MASFTSWTQSADGRCGPTRDICRHFFLFRSDGSKHHTAQVLGGPATLEMHLVRAANAGYGRFQYGPGTDTPGNKSRLAPSNLCGNPCPVFEQTPLRSVPELQTRVLLPRDDPSDSRSLRTRRRRDDELRRAVEWRGICSHDTIRIPIPPPIPTRRRFPPHHLPGLGCQTRSWMESKRAIPSHGDCQWAPISGCNSTR